MPSPNIWTKHKNYGPCFLRLDEYKLFDFIHTQVSPLFLTRPSWIIKYFRRYPMVLNIRNTFYLLYRFFIGTKKYQASGYINLFVTHTPFKCLSYFRPARILYDPLLAPTFRRKAYITDCAYVSIDPRDVLLAYVSKHPGPAPLTPP